MKKNARFFSVKKKNENPSVGIILCKSKDDEVVEYALSRNLFPTLVSEYKVKSEILKWVIDSACWKEEKHLLT